VVVPSWNGAALLPACLESVRRQTYRPLQTIVVDDGSTDDTVDLVTSGFPEVCLARLPCNTGFAGAVNTGLRLAAGEVVALLNNDAVAEPDWVEELAGALRRHPTAGFAASKMLLSDEDATINSAGDFVRRSGEPGNRGVWERDQGQFEREEEVFGACAGAAAYRRSMLDDIGLFDERFRMYCEDVDLAWRAQYAGYRCVYAPRAIVRHRLSASGGGVLSSYQVGRNLVWLLARDLPAPAWRAYWPHILAAQMRQLRDALPHLREPAARARLRGQLAGLATFAVMLQGRPTLGASRRVSNSYLLGLLT
jgi:GT2 family glycosyltransferase